MLQLYPCLECNVQGKIKLYSHLSNNGNCRQGYFATFNCESVEAICTQITKLKKRSYASRQPSRRSLENSQQKVRKYELRKEDYYLNQFNLKTSFTNICKCIICKLHLSEGQTRKLSNSEHHKFILNRKDRRFGDYYICHDCDSNRTQKEIQPPDELVLSSVMYDGFELYAIRHIEGEQLIDINDHANSQNVIDNHDAMNISEDDVFRADASLLLDLLIDNIPDNSQEEQLMDINDRASSQYRIDNHDAANRLGDDVSKAVPAILLDLMEDNNSDPSQVTNNDLDKFNHDPPFGNVGASPLSNIDSRLGVQGPSPENQNASYEDRNFSQRNQGSPNLSMDSHDNHLNNSNVGEDSFLTSSGYSTENSFANANQLEFDANDERRTIQIFMPSSINVKKLYPYHYTPKKYRVSSLIHHGGPITEEILKKMYSVILKKYYSQAPLISGKIVDNINRKLSIYYWTTDKFIFGSDAYVDKMTEEFSQRIEQNGQLYLSVTVSYPLQNSETIASLLVQKDYVVTQQLRGDEQDIFERIYEVHDHKADINCNDQCNTKLLDEFVREEFNLGDYENEIVPVYVFSCLKKMKEFVANIVNCPANPLAVDEYVFYPTFNDLGEMQLRGLIWPKLFSSFNEMIASTSYGLKLDEKKVQEMIQCLESEVTTRTDVAYFQEYKKVAPLIAEKAAILSNSTQVHFDKCSFCKPTELPTFVSFLSRPYSTLSNIYPSRRLQYYMEQFLEDLDMVDKQDITIMQFLERVYHDRVTIRNVTERQVTICVVEEQLIFSIDENLKRLLGKYETFKAIYLYSIMHSDTTKLNLKKNTINEVYTHPYSYFFLLAARSSIEVRPFIGAYNFFLSRCAMEHSMDHHRILSLAEAIATLDGRCSHLPISQSVVNLKPLSSDYIYIKKVDQSSDISFSAEGNTNQFEELVPMKKKFFNRLNAKFLTLAEFVIWYDDAEEKSIELFQAYKEKLENIINSEILNVDATDFLPEFILISDGNVFELRKKRKVLKVENRDMDQTQENYCQYLLFSKYLFTENISEADVNNLVNEQVPLDDIIQCNVLHYRRKKLFPYQLKALI